jgi:hypothetical protein
VELTIFRYRFLDNGVKVVELVRKNIQLKPYVKRDVSIIDLVDLGNEFPRSASSAFQRLSVLPVDESQFFGEHYNGQFFPRKGSTCDVEVHHRFQRDDPRISKWFWSFEFEIPALTGMAVTARFRRRLWSGRHTTKLRGQGMWKGYEGGTRGDLYVVVTIT